MEKSVRQKTLSGVIWSFIERFSVQGLQFFIGIVVARLLSPDDYGLVGMLFIFMSISQTFIDSGFENALIQKKDRNSVDYSTIFYFNITIGLSLYLILFFLSPYIARFYNVPQLENIAKVIFTVLIIYSLGTIQRAIVIINVDFKTQVKATTIAVLVSGSIGIWMAYSGYGVWALVTQNLTSGIVGTALMWYYIKWRPQWLFSWKSFKSLFSFGSRVLLSGLLETIYRHLYTLSIGKKFTLSDLGYYTRADSLAQFPSANISTIINRVIYPILSSIQDEPERTENIYRRYLRLAIFIIFPMMTCLAALSRPLVLVLLSEKWEYVSVLLQIFCFACMWYPVLMMNQDMLLIKGRSDIHFRAELLKKIVGITILFITLPMGLIPMCVGIVISTLIALFISFFYIKKLTKMGVSMFLKDLLPSLLLSLSMGLIVWSVSTLTSIIWLQLIISPFVGIIYYISISYIIKSEELKELYLLIKKRKIE